jgi:hypothetical protein
MDATLNMVLVDIDAMARKVALLPRTNEVIMATGLLLAAAHILRGVPAYQQSTYSQVSQPPNYQPPQPYLADYPPAAPQVPYQPPVPPNPNGMDLEAVRQQVNQRMAMATANQQPPGRNLIEEMAGPLPSVRSKRKLRVVDPLSLCDGYGGGCGGPVNTHKWIKAKGLDRKGRAIHILCSGEHVLCPPEIEA